MAQPVRIEPDLGFIKELQAVGGESLKKCYQCATCSVACPISPDAGPYPRKEMVWAAWGLKDKLLSDIDIWLCHNCGTCSDLCPRGAKPGDLLAALRNMIYKRLSKPAVIGQWMSSAKGLPALIGIPAILYLVIWIIRAQVLGTAFPLGEAEGNGYALAENGRVIYGLLFPETLCIDPIFVLVALFVAVVFFKGARDLIAIYKPAGTTLMLGQPKKGIIRCAAEVILEEILPHKKFDDCGKDKADRKLGHMGVFFGFIALFVVTSFLAAGFWNTLILNEVLGTHLHNPFHTPLSFANPVKLLAVVGMLSLLGGLTLLTKRRLALEKDKHTSSFHDWYLLGVIWAVAVTGTCSMLLRLANVPVLAYPMYYLHLVSVFMLFAYLPWSKLGHLVYRTVALIYARYMGRRPV